MFTFRKQFEQCRLNKKEKHTISYQIFYLKVCVYVYTLAVGINWFKTFHPFTLYLYLLRKL